MKNPSRKIKKFLNDHGVKNSVSTYHGTITVTLKSNASEEIMSAVKGMGTQEAHGSIMDDTRYYTGLSVQFDFKFEPSEEDNAKAKDIMNYWSDEVLADRRLFNHHVKAHLRKDLGASGVVIAMKYNNGQFTIN